MTATVVPLRTVEEVTATSSLHQAAQTDQLRRRLGKLGHLDERRARERSPLRLVTAQAPPNAPTFPLGARTRKVDGSGRLKFTGDDLPSRTLGWEPGALQATLVEGWLLLSQPDHLVGASPARYSTLPSFTASNCGGIERVGLKPAHLGQVALPSDRHLLVAAFPEESSLVVVDPAACLRGAPTAVLAALGTIPSQLDIDETSRPKEDK